MGLNFDKFWESARHMADAVIARLPSVILAIVVFFLFYILSVVVARIIRRTTHRHRENLGVVFSRLIGAATFLIGFLVAFSIVAPSFQAGDLIKVLGIGSVAIGFAFQNILQNFLAGLLRSSGVPSGQLFRSLDPFGIQSGARSAESSLFSPCGKQQN
jgi:small conductance mechanosensitive channel